MKKIPWWNPPVSGGEKKALSKVIDSKYWNDGPVTRQFEKEFAKKLGVQYAVGVTSGTIAIFLALKANGIGAGDEVLVPDLTFIATANAVSLTGARPIFVDIDPETLCVSPDAVQKAIGKKTKAIIPVHVSGRGASMVQLKALAKKYRLVLIEDAAEALFSKYQGRYLGTWGDAGCFSFSPNKTMTTGQGGMVVTNSDSIHKRLVALKDQGRPFQGTGGDDKHPYLGFNFKLTNLQSAIGLTQLQDVDRRVRKLKSFYRIYERELAGLKDLKILPFQVDRGESPQWIDAISVKREKLADALDKQGIGFRRFWYPLHTQKPYSKPKKSFPQADYCSRHGLWLPSSLMLKEADIYRVCRMIKKIVVSL